MLFEKKKIEIGGITIKNYNLFNITIFKKITCSLEGWKEYCLFGVPIYDSNGLSVKNTVENFTPVCIEDRYENKEPVKISVLIEWSNNVEFLNALKCVLKQSFRNFEIIVSYDAKRQVDQLVSKYGINVIYFDGSNFLDGLKSATGKYVAFCESGDKFVDDNLLLRVEALARYNYPHVIFNDAFVAGKSVYHELIKVEKIKDRKLLFKRVNRLSDEQWRKRNCLSSLSCLLIDRETLLSCDLNSPNELLSDWWILRQVCKTNDVIMLSEKLAILGVSERKIEKFNLHPIYKELLISKADLLMGYRTHVDLVFDKRCVNLKRSFGTFAFRTGRIAVFASFNPNGVVDEFVVYYLRELKKVVDGIIFVCDNPIFPEELKKIEPYVIYVDCHRHGEYDFGSYKIGVSYIIANNLLGSVNELILCNDSCYGPVFSFQSLFLSMLERKKKVDFWGISRNFVVKNHIQSFFLVFKKRVISDPEFVNFLLSVKRHDDVREVILNYEVELTDFLEKRGYIYDTVADLSMTGAGSLGLDYVSLGIPLVKRKAIDGIYYGKRGKISRLLKRIKKNNMDLYSIIKKAQP